jgi:hypothetical protein
MIDIIDKINFKTDDINFYTKDNKYFLIVTPRLFHGQIILGDYVIMTTLL